MVLHSMSKVPFLRLLIDLPGPILLDTTFSITNGDILVIGLSVSTARTTINLAKLFEVGEKKGDSVSDSEESGRCRFKRKPFSSFIARPQKNLSTMFPTRHGAQQGDAFRISPAKNTRVTWVIYSDKKQSRADPVPPVRYR